MTGDEEPGVVKAEQCDGTTPSLKVLVVDDYDDGLMATLQVLEALGCDAVGARTGRDALAAASLSRPGLVLIDYELPDGTGTTLARQIAAMQLPGPPRLVLVTGWSVGDILREIEDVPVEQVVQKPLAWADLARLVQGHEAGKRA